MKLKVCGMRDAANIEALGQLAVDFMGFIFYPKSKRFVEKLPAIKLPPSIKRVGVFVNAEVEMIIEKAALFELNYLQLHGNESPEYCLGLKGQGFNVIKAFAVSDDFDFQQLNAYEDCCDYFLLDAKGKDYGGNGIQFNWQLLQQYQSNKPFFLSGGIDSDSVAAVLALELPQLYALDVNSKFETAPAFKNIEKIKAFHQALVEHPKQQQS